MRHAIFANNRKKLNVKHSHQRTLDRTYTLNFVILAAKSFVVRNVLVFGTHMVTAIVDRSMSALFVFTLRMCEVAGELNCTYIHRE